VTAVRFKEDFGADLFFKDIALKEAFLNAMQIFHSPAMVKEDSHEKRHDNE